MKPMQITICLLTLLTLTPPLLAGDPEKGKQKATEVCASCHGLDGVSKNPIWPHIGGQYEDYLLHSLRGYQNGERQNAVMQGMVAALTDEQLKDLAAYYAAQPGVLHPVPGR